MADSGLILIADDNETVLRTTAVLLSEEGFHCDRAANAEQALRLLAENDYDLLVTDWKMPGNTELELVRAVQQVRRGIPVIVITGYPQLSQTLQTQGIHIFADVIKPFQFEDLLDVVRKGVEAGRARRIEPPHAPLSDG